MADGTTLAHRRQDDASGTGTKAEATAPRHAMDRPVVSPVSGQALKSLVSDPSFESVKKKLPKPRHYDYVPEFTFTGGCWRVTAVLPYAFSNKSSIFSKREKYKELVVKFSKSAEFREGFEKDLKEYFGKKEHRVDWLESVWLEWGTKGSAPLITILPERGTQMCDLGGDYVSHNSDTDEQLNVLMACTCIFLERLYLMLDKHKALAKTKRLFGKEEIRNAEGDVVSIDLKKDQRK